MIILVWISSLTFAINASIHFTLSLTWNAFIVDIAFTVEWSQNPQIWALILERMHENNHNRDWGGFISIQVCKIQIVHYKSYFLCGTNNWWSLLISDCREKILKWKIAKVLFMLFSIVATHTCRNYFHRNIVEIFKLAIHIKDGNSTCTYTCRPANKWQLLLDDRLPNVRYHFLWIRTNGILIWNLNIWEMAVANLMIEPRMFFLSNIHVH